jgi:hemolysin activation/secretion protein
LKSDTYIINELYRFGVIKSIRGFAENSLQASFMTAIITEYRYIISPDLYLHSIIDYGYYQDDSTNSKGNLLGFGLGLGVQTKNGLLKLAIANGSAKNQQIKFYNTIITICYNVKF